MIVGKLYRCPKYLLSIYPSKAMATKAATSGPKVVPRQFPEDRAAYWSELFGCKVCYSHPGEIFMILERDGEFLHVLLGEKLGWIIYRDWMDIVEVVNSYDRT